MRTKGVKSEARDISEKTPVINAEEYSRPGEELAASKGGMTTSLALRGSQPTPSVGRPGADNSVVWFSPSATQPPLSRCSIGFAGQASNSFHWLRPAHTLSKAAANITIRTSLQLSKIFLSSVTFLPCTAERKDSKSVFAFCRSSSRTSFCTSSCTSRCSSQ